MVLAVGGDCGSVAGQRGEGRAEPEDAGEGLPLDFYPKGSGKRGAGLKPECWDCAHLLLQREFGQLVCYVKCPQERALQSLL